MTPERWQKIENVFHEAVARRPAERAAFLARACAGDAELRAEVEALLAEDGGRETLFATLINEAAGSFAERQRGALTGQRLGPYLITGALGEGGMAEVYRAVRDDEQFRKEVAIKLVKPGMASDFMLSRFRHERQILANLDHPNVARLFDGGTTPDGLPYFVMEYVAGAPITEHCEARGLPLRRRLELFRKVCAAVSHAHRNLVVHRDLKPSNIFVADDGEPKLLDFGIAKLLDPELAPASLGPAHTATAMRMMTPDYAAPEQVRGEPVTTATDVYALGAVLYELLTGARAHELKGRSLQEIDRVICREEVVAPSERVARGNVAHARLRRELRGDLDNIVLMAMRKEPGRRYPSVDQLSEDIRRYLEGRPVKARPDTLGYRAGKFVRRHRAAVAAAFVILALLVGFALAATRQASRIARERDRANQVTEFLVGLFEVSQPSEAKGNAVTAREVLDAGAGRVRRELKGQPEVQAAMMDSIGRVYYKLGLYDAAEPLLEESLEARRRLLGEDHPDVLASLVHRAELHHSKGELEPAEQLYREALEKRRRLHGSRHAETAASLNSLGVFLKDKGDYAGAEGPLREALEMRRALFGESHPDTAASLAALAVLFKQKGEHAAAEPFYREALEMRRRLLGEDHPDVATSLNDLAVLLDTRGRYEESEALYRQSLALSRKLYGEEHHYVATMLSNLAGVLKNRGLYEEAEPLYRQSLELKRRRLGAEHPEVAVVLNNYANLLSLKGDFRAAEPMFREAVELKRKTLGASHPSTAISVINLAEALSEQGQHRAAEPLFREALAASEKALAPTHWRLAEMRSSFGSCLAKLGRHAEAEELLKSGHAALRTAFGDAHERTRKAAARLAEFYEDAGRIAEAKP
jgi:tetratricopeptide (TPR) repeat protein/tRNA A-37 threonylcarbamoyl transferase component Bud32